MTVLVAVSITDTLFVYAFGMYANGAAWATQHSMATMIGPTRKRDDLRKATPLLWADAPPGDGRPEQRYYLFYYALHNETML